MLTSFLFLAWALVPVTANLPERPALPHTTSPKALIGKLGSREYRERESATRALDELGGSALPELRKAAQDKDPEVRRRAETLVTNIERREETSRLLAPRKVHLDVNDAPLSRVVAEVARQSGFSIAIEGNRKEEFNKKKVTLDTGETTFWKALDAVCRTASLTESPFALHKVASNPHEFNGARRPTIEQRQALYFNPSQAAFTQFYLYPCDLKHARDLGSGAVSYAGALRCRIGQDIRNKKDEILLPLEITAQPNVAWEQLKDIRIEHALDDLGQELSQASSQSQGNSIEVNRVVMGFGNGMVLNGVGALEFVAEQSGYIRLRAGAQRSKSIQTLTGTLTGQVRTPIQTLVTVENVRKQAGKSFQTSYGECLEVVRVTELDNGVLKLEIRLKEPPTMLAMPGNGRIAARGNLVLGGQQVVFNRLGVRTNGNLQADLRVKDAHGNSLAIDPNVQYAITLSGNMLATTVTMQIKPAHGVSAVHTLEWAGQHSTTIEVPFKFTNIPLP